MLGGKSDVRISLWDSGDNDCNQNEARASSSFRSSLRSFLKATLLNNRLPTIVEAGSESGSREPSVGTGSGSDLDEMPMPSPTKPVFAEFRTHVSDPSNPKQKSRITISSVMVEEPLLGDEEMLPPGRPVYHRLSSHPQNEIHQVLRNKYKQPRLANSAGAFCSVSAAVIAGVMLVSVLLATGAVVMNHSTGGDVEEANKSPWCRHGHDIAIDSGFLYVMFGEADIQHADTTDIWRYGLSGKSKSKWRKVDVSGDPKTGEIPWVRKHFTLSNSGSGNLLLYGGENSRGVASTEMWKFKADANSGSKSKGPSWTFYRVAPDHPPVWPEARSRHAAYYDQGRLIVYGGVDTAQSVWHTDLWSYGKHHGEHMRESWSRWALDSGKDGFPTATVGMSLNKVPKIVNDHGVVHAVLFGGRDAAGALLNDLWLLVEAENGEALVWKKAEPPEGDEKHTWPQPKEYHVAAWLNDCLYVFGGNEDQNGRSFSDHMWKYHVLSGKWSRAELGGPSPPNRWKSAIAPLEDNAKLAVFGGEGKFSQFNDIWLFDESIGRWNMVVDSRCPTE